MADPSKPDSPPRAKTRRRRSPAQRAIRIARKRIGKSAERTASAFVNGLDWWLRDPTDVVGHTPYELVHQRDKLAVRRYERPDTTVDWGMGRVSEVEPVAIPVLLVPPLMVQPFIFDLTENRSLVMTMLGAGLDSYLVDWGEPDASDRRVTVSSYVIDWLPDAIDAVCRESGSERVFLLGYCQGGMFALMQTAANADDRVAGIVAIASPIDSAKMGVIGWIARNAHEQIDQVVGLMGNVPGELSSRAFKLMDPVKTVTRYTDLFLNLYNDEYVDGFDALTAWTDNFIDYPEDAFRELLREFMKGNKLKNGCWELGDRVIDLRTITCPLLAFAGQTDNVVPIKAVRELLAVAGSTDARFEVVPGGHMGVFAGRHAPEAVWKVAADWMRERAG